MPASAYISDLITALGGGDVEEDEAALLRYLAVAQAVIEGPGPIGVGMPFEATADSTRTFDARADVDGRTLYLDYPLISVTTLTNGDGQAIPSTEYVFEPRNRTPHHAITLKFSSAYVWQWTTSPENAISVVGKWGYSLTFPANIIEALIGLAKYYYQHRNQPTADIQVLPELGTIRVPRGIPAEVKAILDGYRTHL